MEPDAIHDKRHVHELIDRLAPSQLTAVRGLLEVMVDPVSRALNDALVDEEPFSEAEQKAVAEADDWLQHNQPIPHQKVLSELGLTMADWDRMSETPLPEEAPGGNG